MVELANSWSARLLQFDAFWAWLAKYPFAYEYFATLVVYSKYMAFFLVLEMIFAAKRQQTWRAKLFNLQYLMLYMLIYLLIYGHVLSWVVQGSRNVVPQLFGLLNVQSLLHPFAFALFYLFVYDFFYYWFHRWQHRSALLWREHRLHHTEPHVNVTTSLRHHWLEEPLKVFVVQLPLAIIFAAQPADLGLFGVILGGWVFFIHANMRLHLGPLGLFVAGPQVHRIHHGFEPRYIDKNFAALFPIWDRLFGTYYAPQKDEYPDTGLADGRDYNSLLSAALSPIVEPQLPPKQAILKLETPR